MGGRDEHPGEGDPFHGTRSGTKYHSRVARGRLGSLSDTKSGAVTVDTLDITGSRRVTVPVLWMSINGANTAWGRFQPAGGEYVHVEYRNDDTAVVVGYDATADKNGIGYSELSKAADNSQVGYASFKELKPLEFDFKSGGDAYIFGSNTGTLLLSGGQSFIRLNKQDYRIESKTGTYLYTSGTVTQRLGTVTRKLKPTDNTEAPVNMGSYKEFSVDVNQSLPTGTPGIQSRAKLNMGDILDDVTNIPTIGDFGSPLRFRLSLGDGSDTMEVFNLAVDSLGNVSWKQPGAAPMTNLTIGNMTIDFNGVLATTSINLTGSPQVSVAIADHLQTLWTNLITQLQALTVGTAFGPSSPPLNAAAFPPWLNIINSTKLKIPDL